VACATGPSVDTTLAIEVNYDLILISMKKITQNSIFSPTLGQNIRKPPSRNPTHEALSKNTKSLLQFCKIF
jgi:hypothetical protein